ncbi:MAG: hypothetical protein ABL925_20735 [Methylococcales bacterium]
MSTVDNHDLPVAELHSSPVISKKILLCLFTVAGLVLVSCVYFAEFREGAKNPLANDFFKFYISASNVLKEQRPYWPAPDRASPTSHCNRELQNQFGLVALVYLIVDLRHFGVTTHF